MFRISIVISHPIQYHAPLYSYLAKDGRFQLKVFYMSDRGARPFYDNFARTTVKYDNPILDGYEYEFLSLGEPRGWWRKKFEFLNFQLGEQLFKFSPQAVYFHGYANPSYWFPILSCRKRGIKVFLRGENESILPRPLWRIWIRELFLKILLPNIDDVLYIGQHNKEFFLKRGFPKNRLFYVPYCVDNNYFKAGYSRIELDRVKRRILNKYALGEDTRLFIFTHKLRPTMRPLDAIRAFSNLPDSDFLHAALLMCGDGELRHKAEAAVRARGRVKIIFTGYLSQAELKEHMLASDVMINPAEEPWGCSVNEGLACGLVIVSSDRVIGWPDMVAPGANGFVYRCGNLQELSQIIHKLCNLPFNDLIRMKEESLKLSQKLNFEVCANGLASAMQGFTRPKAGTVSVKSDI